MRPSMAPGVGYLFALARVWETAVLLPLNLAEGKQVSSGDNSAIDNLSFENFRLVTFNQFIHLNKDGLRNTFRGGLSRAGVWV